MTPFSFSSRGVAAILSATLLGAAVACSPDSLVKADPPSNIVLPDAVTSATSAVSLYNGAVLLFDVALGGGGSARGTDNYVQNSGFMTDELMTGILGSNSADLRNNALLYSAGGESAQATLYSRLQTARTAAFQARQGLQRYGLPDTKPLVARMFALEGYSIVMLAEYFCNGIPLTMTPLEGAPVNTAGLTTDTLYARALTLFDSAVAVAGDSTRFANLAKVGKGRVLLDQGKFADAAAAVADVPLGFVYNADFQHGLQFVVGGNPYYAENWLQYPYTAGTPVVTAQDHEGGNGEVWSTDPRTTSTVTNVARQLMAPNKYPSGDSPIRLADGLEAQLIRAEAAFNANPESGEWLAILNDLRANCTTASGCTNAPGIVGGTTQLPPLADSITPLKRLRQVMSERAHWLYLTGHREGDMRRMLRAPYDAAPYNLSANLVYPSGTYVNLGYTGLVTEYGSDVVAIPKRAEQLYNPLYQGCFDLNP